MFQKSAETEKRVILANALIVDQKEGAKGYFTLYMTSSWQVAIHLYTYV